MKPNLDVFAIEASGLTHRTVATYGTFVDTVCGLVQQFKRLEYDYVNGFCGVYYRASEVGDRLSMCPECFKPRDR